LSISAAWQGIPVWGLLILVVLWVLIAPIFALVAALRAGNCAFLVARRIEQLEARLAAAPAVGAPPAPEAPPAAEPLAPSPATEVDQPPPVPAPAGLSATEPEAPPPPGAAAPAPASPPREGESLESKIGARWSVLVGGLALALGAVFLVRYSIEAGLLGPAARIVLGFVLAAILFAAGERLRRRDRALDLPIFAKADIPAILTAAGGVALFATIYAAHALYGFIGAGAALVLLTAAGLVTLALSVIHGPALAALGALGSYAAPLLVASAEPNPLAVVLHTLAVTAAVLGMARIRGWRWLGLAGILASLGWGTIIGLVVYIDADPTGAELALTAGLALTYLGALVFATEPDTLRDRPPNVDALAALAGLAALTVLYGLVNPAYPVLVSGILLSGVLGAAATRWTSIAWAAVFGGALAVVTVMLLPPVADPGEEIVEFGAIVWSVLGDEGLARFALKAAAIGLVIGAGSFLSAERAAGNAPFTAGLFAAAGAGAPLLILVVTYLRHVPFETRPAIGIAALVMAAVFATITERLIARRPRDDTALAPALYAAGAVLALSFAFSVGLATRFVPLALSLGTAGVVWVSLYRPVRALAWLAVVTAALACAAIILGPPFTPEEIGTRPFLNGLVLRLGLPAAAVLFAGEMLRRHRDATEARILQTLGLVIAAVFVAFEIRHYSGGGDLNAGFLRLGEQSAYTLAALAFSLGLQRIARRTESKVYELGSLVLGVIGALLIAVAHFFTVNPIFTGEDVGTGRVFNLLLPGYLLPALLAAWVAAAARPVRPRWYVLMIAALALLLAFAYVTLMVRHGFRGPRLDLGGVSDAENWTYSAIWLVLGIALLAAGIFLRSTMIRGASGLVIAAVVLKVFLFDMAALTGALRAVSFLGLGATLILIGRLYQRLLMRGAAAVPTTAPPGV
jgi:uncharacterized membrane protein